MTIEFDAHWIKVEMVDGCGRISSNLKSDDENDIEYNSAIDGIESLILACAVSVIDITDSKFVQSIETAVDACSNNY